MVEDLRVFDHVGFFLSSWFSQYCRSWEMGSAQDVTGGQQDIDFQILVGGFERESASTAG